MERVRLQQLVQRGEQQLPEIMMLEVAWMTLLWAQAHALLLLHLTALPHAFARALHLLPLSVQLHGLASCR